MVDDGIRTPTVTPDTRKKPTTLQTRKVCASWTVSGKGKKLGLLDSIFSFRKIIQRKTKMVFELIKVTF